ncbi:hypothetical protein M3J09_003703 [Ascochyta lentis]
MRKMSRSAARSEGVMWPSKPPLRELTNQSFPRTPSDTLEPDWSALRRYQVLRMESFLISFRPCSQALY